MSDDTVRILICIFKGEDTFFQIKTHIDATVLDLKALIRAQKLDTLQDVDAIALSVYKVNTLDAKLNIIVDAFWVDQ
jgi:hypothetical protein